MNLIELLSNPLFLMFSSIFIGQLIGRINYKSFKLGSSGGLFVGIMISYFATVYLQAKAGDAVILKGALIPSELFQLSLIGFIASVGLLASQNIRGVIKNYGYKFMILAFVITGTGALSIRIFIKLFFNDSKASIIGSYAGALTSSPALATAIEVAKGFGGDAEAMVGLGYSIAYIPAVIFVILFVQFLGKRHQNKNGTLEKPLGKDHQENVDKAEFNIISFSIVCLLGMLVGKININLGEYLGSFSLGATGGVLITALLLGDRKKIGSLNFNMNSQQLVVVRDISLNMFLSIVGLNYGYSALNLIRVSGMQLLVIGITTSVSSIVTGYLVGKKLLKLHTINLIGGICGGMTSTPGLSASIEAFNSDEVTAGYGATYPFGLFFKILFINILFKL